MAKYNWNIDTIQERYHDCVMRWDKEDNPDLKALYFETGKCLKYYIESIENQTQTPLLELYNFEKDNLKEREFLWPLYQEFSQINPKAIPNTPKLKTSSLSPKDLLDLTHDFYKSLNSFFFGHFMQNFYRRNDHIKFTPQNINYKYDGVCIFIPHTNEAFIEIIRNYTLEDVVKVIHEYGHATGYSINFLNRFYPNLYYTEIISLFFELISADFLGNIFGQDKSTIIKAINHNTMSELAKITSFKIDLITAESLLPNGYNRNKDIKQTAQILLDLDSLKTEYLFADENLEISDYTIGYIIAIELYFIYLEDKDRALHILKKIILYNAKSELDYFKHLKRLGIIPNLHIQEYESMLQKDVATLSRKKSTQQ